MTENEPQFIATIELLRRTGLASFTMRDHELEGEPTVFMFVGTWPDPKGELPPRHEVGAALHPLTALLRLAEQTIDGGQCRHCKRPTVFDPDPFGAGLLDVMGCVYRFDPELRSYRRSCEGKAGGNRAARRARGER